MNRTLTALALTTVSLTTAFFSAPQLSAQQSPQARRGTTNVGTLPGIAMPERDVQLSTPVEGVVTTILVEEGALVTAGQPLAKLDDRVAVAAVAAARLATDQSAQIAHAEAEVSLARQKVDRLESAGDAINALQMAEARVRLAQAEASLASARHAQLQAELNLALEEARLERMTIRAPFSGHVSKIAADEGATLTTQHELLHLVSLDTLIADVYAPLSLFGRLEVGATYSLQAGAPLSRNVEAELVYVDPVLETASQRCRCRFRIINHNGEMPAGFTVRLPDNPMPVIQARPAPSQGR